MAATVRQKLGTLGEKLVSQTCACPRCKRNRTLKLLPPNFKCADIICDFCGYLAQVKTGKVRNIAVVPKMVLGATWAPQEERMAAGIYIPLFLVLMNKDDPKNHAIYYLSADLQKLDHFKSRKKLGENAKTPGWQGFYYDFKEIENRIVRVA